MEWRLVLLSLFLISTSAVSLFPYLPAQNTLGRCDNCNRPLIPIGPYTVFGNIMEQFSVSSRGFASFPGAPDVYLDTFYANSDYDIG